MKGFVYEIRCKDVNVLDSYIGSTCNLKQRKKLHKIHCNNQNSKKYNLKVYKFIREKGYFENFEFHILEEVEYENKIELLKRERYWIEIKKSSLNCNIPTRTQKEYGKQWRENNKDKIKECNKEYIKQWREDNKDKISEYKKEWYENNKDKIKEYRNQKIKCDLCGSIITRGNLSRHQKYIKCQEHNK